MSCHVSGYKLFLWRSTVLSSCTQAWSHMFTRASLSSVQQRLVICDWNINTVVMCGGLFVLSSPCVFLKIESVLLQRRRRHFTGLIWTCRPPWEEAAGSLNLGAVWRRRPTPRLRSTPVALSDQCFHRRRLPQRTLLLAWLWGGEMRGQGSSEARVHKKGKNGIHGGMVEVEGG